MLSGKLKGKSKSDRKEDISGKIKDGNSAFADGRSGDTKQRDDSIAAIEISF